MAVVSALALTGFGLLTAKPLLRLLQTHEELMPDASTYLLIIYAGAVRYYSGAWKDKADALALHARSNQAGG